MGPANKSSFKQGLQCSGEPSENTEGVSTAAWLEVLEKLSSSTLLFVSQVELHLVDHFRPVLATLLVRHVVRKEPVRLCFKYFPIYQQILNIPVDVEVCHGIEDLADAALSVPAGPPDLLVVALHVSRRAVMDHVTHVWLIDSHSEGDGGHDHLHAIEHELFVRILSLVHCQAGMVHPIVDSLICQHLGNALHLLPTWTIDDGRPGELVAMLAVPPIDHHTREVPPGRAAFLLHLQVKVWSVEGGAGDLGQTEAEQATDVLLDVGCGGGGEGEQRHPRELGLQLAQLLVGGSEVAAPLRDFIKYKQKLT